MFKRKLFKRALPVILSVAMIFQSMPATALAAENEMTEVVETTVEDSGSESDAGDEAKEPANEEPEAPAAEQPEASTPVEETKQEEVSTPAESTVQDTADASTEEPKQEETSAPAESTTQEETSAPVETAAPETTAAEEEASTEELLQKAEGETAKLETVIKINDNSLDYNLSGFTRDQSASEGYEYTTTYQESSRFGSVKSFVKNAVTVQVDGEDKAALREDPYLKLQYQSEKDGAYTDMDGLPTNAGKYRLRVYVDAVPELCGNAEEFVYFEITKAELKLNMTGLATVQPGTAISDFKKDVSENYKLTSGSFSYDQIKTLTALDPADIKVYEFADAKKADIETTDTEFSTEKTYVATVSVKFKDEAATGANYTITAEDYYIIEVGDLTETTVKVELKKPVDVRKYDPAKELNCEEIEKEYINTDSLTVTKTEGDSGKEVSIFAEGTNVREKLGAPAWYTREQTDNIEMPALDEETQFEADGYRYTKFDGNPKDAGEYYIVYTYPGETGKYKKAYSNAVQVSIDPASLAIEAADVVLKAGMNKDDVAKALMKAGYVLYNVKDGKTDTVYETKDQKDFFGVSYDNTNATQYFVPEFTLEQREELDKDQQTETEKWDEWGLYDGKSLTLGTADKKVEYRIVPTGYKVVYDSEDKKLLRKELTDRTTNSAEKNYIVDMHVESAVTLGEFKETSIDTKAIVEAFKAKGGKVDAENSGSSVDNPLSTIYNQDLLFETRAEYKKAVVNGANVKDADPSITYTWEKADRNAYENYITTAPDKDEETAKQDAKDALLDSFVSQSYWTHESSFISPVDAALYRLHIEYRDAGEEYMPSEAYVYFQIKQRAIITAAVKPYSQYADYGDPIQGITPNYGIIVLNENNDETTLDGAEVLPVDPVQEGVKYDVAAERKDKTSGNWVKATESVFMEGESYRVSYTLDDMRGEIADGSIKWELSNKDELPPEITEVWDLKDHVLKWDNFTNRKSYNFEKGEWEYYSNVPGEVIFGSKDLDLSVNSDITSSKVYDAEPAFKEVPQGFVTIKDKATGEAVDYPVNADAENAVILYWKWNTSYGNEEVAFDKVIYGGTYTLYAYFAGNDSYKAFDQPVKKADGSNYTFEITKRDISITPLLEDKPAGELAQELVNAYEIRYDNVPQADEYAFQYGLDARYDWDNDEPVVYEGYAALSQNYTDDDDVQICKFDSKIYVDNDRIYGDREYLRTNKEYTVKLDAALVFPYNDSYNVTWKPETKKIVDRGMADVQYVDFLTHSNEGYKIGVDVYGANDADGAYTITPREGIPFAYKGYYGQLYDANGNSIPMDKNYIAFSVRVPREFLGNTSGSKFTDNAKLFVFENSVKAANGYVLKNSYTKTDNGVTDGYIDVLFPVALNSDGKAGVPDSDGKVETAPQFTITWEEGYADTFKLNLENAKLESNLKNAVSPKSLAFNGVQTKMAVGEQQQLDVKIKKAQLGDIVRINYRLAAGSPEDVLHVDPETGRVTALQVNKGAVTVEAYPVRLAEDGKTFEEIPAGKGVVKPAKTKITVTEVTAPAVKSVTVLDNASARVSYTVPDNGYRREIYVVETDKASVKSWTAQKFDTTIDEMKNGQWKDAGFAIQPVYMTNETIYTESRGCTADHDKYYDTKKKLFSIKLSGMETANGTYVVYVRNVSAERVLEDGAQVTFSKAGTVKNFVTTLAKVQDVIPAFNVTSADDRKNPVGYYGYDEDGYVVQKYDKKDIARYTHNIKVISSSRPDNNVPVYLVDLSAKSAQVLVDGWFNEKASNPAAEGDDYIKKTLPLKKTDKTLLTSYVDPKVTYAVTDTVKRPILKNGKWEVTNPSKFAAISNSGKITFKGVDRNGLAQVYVWALTDNGKANYCLLYIGAVPDSITGKTAKMKVGDQLRLATLLEYKEGKTKVPGYRSGSIEITSTQEDIEKAGFELREAQDGEKINGEECIAGEWIITAKAPTPAKNFALQIKDHSFVREPSDEAKTATVTLTASQLDPVKGLKAVYTDDKHITLNFTHAGNPEAFDIEVKDARGSIVYKKLTWNNDKWVVGKDDADYVQRYQKSIIWGGLLTYFEKTKTYAFTIDTDRLVRLSAYTISVTPVYEGQYSAKSVTAKAKTTNIPASYADVDTYASGKGGQVIYYNGDGMGDYKWDENNNQIAKYPYFTSGNTYTLSIDTDGNAKDRVTDTLTWKSSNTKVASIKANPGSYTATFKPVQQGVTTISVTSKITKKVIARWDVKVKAVGNGKDFGGDYELTDTDSFYKDILAKWDPFYEGKLEVLTLTTPVQVSGNNDRTWVSFTAPVYGEYTFDGCQYTVYGSRNMDAESSSTSKQYKLEAGQTIYFRVTGTGTLSVTKYTDFTRLTVDNDEANKLTVPKTSWIAFTAPEDNYYTFHGSISGYTKDNESYSLSNNGSVAMKAGETIFIKANQGTLYVTYRKAAETLENNSSKEVTLTAKEKTQYIRFTAPATQDYIFEAPADVTVRFYEATGNTALTVNDYFVAAKRLAADGDATEPAAPKTQKKTLYLEAGTTIIIEVSVNTMPANKTEVKATVSVASSAVKELKTDAPQTVTKGTTATLSFKVPEASNAKYSFSSVSTAEGEAKVYGVMSYYNDEYKSVDLYDDSLEIKDGKASINDITIKTGDTIYIKVNASTEAADVKVSVSVKGSVGELTDSVSLTLIDDFEDNWYTFEAKSAGWYEFGASSAKAGDNGAHTVYVQSVSGIYSDDYARPYVNLTSSTDGTPSTQIVQLKAGDKVVLKASVDRTVGNKDAKTDAALAVKKVSVTPINLGETKVSLNAKDSVNYYSFTAETSGTHSVKWTPDTDTGDAEAKYGSQLSGMTDLPLNTTFYNGSTYYFSVKQTGDKAVSGTLSVSNSSSNTKVLTVGKNDFELKEAASYKFIVPADNALGYKLTVANTTTVGEGETADVTVGGNYVPAGETLCIPEQYWVKKDNSYEISVSGNGKAVKGSITVEAIVAVDFPADGNAKVTKATPAWYQFSLTDSGRYTFIKEDKDGTNTTFFTLGSNGQHNTLYDGSSYVKSGTVIYAQVTTSSKDEKTAVVKKPEKITPKTLALDTEVTVEAAEGKTVGYYEFEADGYAEYTVVGASSIRYSVPDEQGSDYISGTTVVLKNKEKLFITASKDAKLKVTKNDITKLELGVQSGDVTLEKGKSAIFSYNIFETDTYAFKTTSDKVAITGLYGSAVDKNAYKAKELKSGASGTFTVTNGTEETVTFKVSMTKVVPKELEAGAEAVKVVKNDNADVYEWFSFKADEDYRYVFAKGTDKAIAYSVIKGDHVSGSLWTEAQYIEKYTKKKNNEWIVAVSAAEEANISVSKLQPKTSVEVSENGTNVDVKAADVNSKWISFTAGKTGEYSFAFTSEASLPDIYKYESDLTGGWQVRSSYALDQGSSIYFMVDADADVTVNVKVTLTSEVAELKTGANSFDATEKASKAFFTAKESGVYSLKLALDSEDGGASVNTKLDGNGNNALLNKTSTLSYALAAGDSLYITLNMGSKGTVTIEKEASLREFKADEEVGLPVGTTWLKFVPQEDGKYTFAFDKTVKALKTYTSANVSDRKNPSQNLIATELSCQKGSGVYFCIETENPVKIKAEKSLELEEYDLSWLGEYEWELNRGDVYTFRAIYGCDSEMTLPKLYKFRAYSDKFVRVEYRMQGAYDWVSMGSGTSLESSESYWFNRGNYVDFRLTGFADDTVVTVYPVTLETRLDIAYGSLWQEVYGTTGEQTYTFIAPKEGYYRLWLSCDEATKPIRVEFKDASGNVLETRTTEYDEDEGYWSGVGYGCDLSLNQTIKMTVHYENEEDGYSSYFVSANMYTYETLQLNDSVSNSAIAGERVVVRFTPEQSGTYRFRVTNNSLYNEDVGATIWAYISGSEVYLDCGEDDYLEVPLEAGEQYAVYINGGDGEEGYHAFSYTISVEKIFDNEE